MDISPGFLSTSVIRVCLELGTYQTSRSPKCLPYQPPRLHGDMPVDRGMKVAEFADAFNGYMAHLKVLQQKLESGGKDPRSLYPFIERDENQRLTAFRLALAEVFGEK